MSDSEPTDGSRRRTGGAAIVTAAAAAIIAALFHVEGGYVDHPDDPGGATNHGITERVARDHGYDGPMAALPKETAQEIYFDDYIAAPGFDRLLEISVPVAEEAIDSGVNAGPAMPSRWFQIALNSLNRQERDFRDIRVDGRIGPASLAAYAALERVRGKATACRLVGRLMDAQQAGHYLSLASGNSRFESFMPGWIDARIGNVDFERCYR
ncbi:hypothetical protein G5C33_10260 [Sphingosinithalassobacter tenebrarum]|uniref:Uncharacterized protein n=2 Tax=Stakelama tenebrarum TaxID=2711215 RepID=A0A6G6Y6C0_9SPHN|nr:hypothetical protein G5C33_10260 [Sphingosinithalassobacter tenebrarum]